MLCNFGIFYTIRHWYYALLHTYSTQLLWIKQYILKSKRNSSLIMILPTNCTLKVSAKRRGWVNIVQKHDITSKTAFQLYLWIIWQQSYKIWKGFYSVPFFLYFSIFCFGRTEEVISIIYTLFFVLPSHITVIIQRPTNGITIF